MYILDISKNLKQLLLYVILYYSQKMLILTFTNKQFLYALLSSHYDYPKEEVNIFVFS